MRKIMAVVWYQHSLHSFGIVITQNSVGENKAWIGVVAGVDEIKDMINIANYGAKFPITAARAAINVSGRDLDKPIEIPKDEIR